MAKDNGQAPVPPQNLEAEESVLGAMMLAPGAIIACSEILSGQDFYRESHGKMFATAVAMNAAGQPVDAITLADRLEEQGDLKTIGGRERVHELASLVPATANAPHYARIVRDQAQLREMILVGGQIQRFGWDRPADTPELLERVEQMMFGLASTSRRQDDFALAGELLDDQLRRLNELQEKGGDVIGVPSGFRKLDELTAGFQPGNLVVIASRPSMGKSALALCIAANVTIREQTPAALFTLEMSRAEVMGRLISSEAAVESQRLRIGRLSSDDWERVMSASHRIGGMRLHIKDGDVKPSDLRSQARRLKLREPDLGLIVIDYLQLMTSGGTQENRVQEVSAMSRSLKLLAGELDVPIIALSQLSRNVEQRHDKRPMLQDLRESGSIEQDADVVIFIYRDEYYNPEDTDQAGIAEVHVAKQRNGPTDVVKLSFVKRYAKFSDIHLPGLHSV